MHPVRNALVPLWLRGIAARTMSRNPKSPDLATKDARAARTIVLVGLMGAGKSTIGRRLAARLQMDFIDADEEIEAAAGMRITEIFDRFGEAEFRDGERRVIARIINGPACVLATGGGAFINSETRALILEQATAIWLDADIDTLVARVERRDTRPLLTGRDPRQVLTELAALRNPIYAQAPLRVASARSPHDVTVTAILEALQSCPE
jgi:shikimate kinase